MKINYECGACFLRQAKEAMDLASDDEDLKIELMNDIFTFLSSNFYKTTNSNKTGSTIHNMIQEKTGCEDHISMKNCRQQNSFKISAGS